MEPWGAISVEYVHFAGLLEMAYYVGVGGGGPNFLLSAIIKVVCVLCGETFCNP